jgi:hypothetical protein
MHEVIAEWGLCWRVLAYRIEHYVVCWNLIDVLDEQVASIFKVKKLSQERHQYKAGSKQSSGASCRLNNTFTQV